MPFVHPEIPTFIKDVLEFLPVTFLYEKFERLFTSFHLFI